MEYTFQKLTPASDADIKNDLSLFPVGNYDSWSIRRPSARA